MPEFKPGQRVLVEAEIVGTDEKGVYVNIVLHDGPKQYLLPHVVAEQSLRALPPASAEAAAEPEGICARCGLKREAGYHNGTWRDNNFGPHKFAPHKEQPE